MVKVDLSLELSLLDDIKHLLDHAIKIKLRLPALQEPKSVKTKAKKGKGNTEVHLSINHSIPLIFLVKKSI